jgi:ABC-type uncharacterized transport system permease subunit
MIQSIRDALRRVLEFLAVEIAKALHALNAVEAEAEAVIHTVEVEILRDGVCVAEGVIANAGDIVSLTDDVADIIIGNGHARVK